MAERVKLIKGRFKWQKISKWVNDLFSNFSQDYHINKMEMKNAAYGPIGPKRACASQGPLGPSVAFFSLMAEIGPNFLLPFKNSAIFFYGLLLYNQITFLRFVWNLFMYRPFWNFLVFAKITKNVILGSL